MSNSENSGDEEVGYMVFGEEYIRRAITIAKVAASWIDHIAAEEFEEVLLRELGIVAKH